MRIVGQGTGGGETGGEVQQEGGPAAARVPVDNLDLLNRRGLAFLGPVAGGWLEAPDELPVSAIGRDQPPARSSTGQSSKDHPLSRLSCSRSSGVSTRTVAV